MKKKVAPSRRSFLKTASLAATAITIVPRHVLGQGQTPPSQKLNIAAIGVGGMGSGDVESCAKAGENIVALCDPDKNYLAENAKKYPGAKLLNRPVVSWRPSMMLSVTSVPTELAKLITVAPNVATGTPGAVRTQFEG